MIRKVIELSEDDWEVLKKYAKATRKYNEIKGYTVNDALHQMVVDGMNSIASMDFQDPDNDYENVDWL